MKLSESEENYIKSIYKLQENTKKVNTNSLASHLNTKAASVTDMLKKLKSKKILEYKRYYGFRLNENGNKEALKIIRRHRLWEFFLVSKLGMAWDKVHAIAEELEHVSSLELVKKLDEYLGSPKLDPHGDPIPDEKGEMPELKQVALTNFPFKKNGIVSSVSTQTSEMMKMLDHYGISIGSQIRILKTFDFDGSLEIKISKQPACVISSGFAQNIFVYDD
ncbi:MAG: metal-dependent transcriptional regulator [Bacteroidota bacterium]|nr:metal-dependent transcriptional regulator [Bacteroidota bacterium]